MATGCMPPRDDGRPPGIGRPWLGPGRWRPRNASQAEPSPLPDTVAVIESFVVGIGECASPADLERLRAGAPLLLRPPTGGRRGPRRLEVTTAEGRLLGWLPGEDMRALEALGVEPAEAILHVTALVPGFQRSRILIRIVAPPPHVGPPPPPPGRDVAQQLGRPMAGP
jgi:hypothetical protein